MKKLTLVIMTLLLSVVLFGHFNPEAGLSAKDTVFFGIAAIAIPFAKFITSFVWTLLITPLLSKVNSKFARKAIHLMFAPPQK